MKHKLTVFIILVSAVSLLSGCVWINTEVRTIEPSARPMEDREYIIMGSVSAETSQFTLLSVWPVTPPLDYERALTNSMSTHGADNIIDLRCYHERQIWVVGTIDTYYIKGKAITYKDPE